MSLCDIAETRMISMGLNTPVRPADVELATDLASGSLTIPRDSMVWGTILRFYDIAHQLYR